MVVRAQFGQPRKEEGITYAQAMEAFERFHVDSEAAPTVAANMGISYDTICRALGGQIWPAARAYWLDRIFSW